MIQGVVKHRKLHSDRQLVSHAPRFHLQHCKRNFTATDDSSGGRNGLRKDRNTALSKKCAQVDKKEAKTSRGSWINLACNMVIFYMRMRGDHCKPNPEVWLGTRLLKNPNFDSFSHNTHIIISARRYKRRAGKVHLLPTMLPSGFS